jgi:hypothetical protein
MGSEFIFLYLNCSVDSQASVLVGEVTFENDDPCRSAKDHAMELNNIIEDSKITHGKKELTF